MKINKDCIQKFRVGGTLDDKMEFMNKNKIKTMEVKNLYMGNDNGLTRQIYNYTNGPSDTTYYMRKTSPTDTLTTVATTQHNANKFPLGYKIINNQKIELTKNNNTEVIQKLRNLFNQGMSIKSIPADTHFYENKY